MDQQQQPKPPLLKLVIMVKNGATVIRPTLEAVRDHVDEWLVVDTGSSDDTVAVVEQTMPASKGKVVTGVPFVDYATTRNRCLDMALADSPDTTFTLMLDDSFVVVGAGRLRTWLEDMVGDTDSPSYCLTVNCGNSQHPMRLLLRQTAKLRYTSPVHEYINDPYHRVIPESVAYVDVQNTDLTHSHTKQRWQRDVRMLQAELDAGRDTWHAAMFLAQTHANMGNYQQAYDAYEQAVQHPDCSGNTAAEVRKRQASLATKLGLADAVTLWHSLESFASRPSAEVMFWAARVLVPTNPIVAFVLAKLGWGLRSDPHPAGLSRHPKVVQEHLPALVAKLAVHGIKYDTEAAKVGLEACAHIRRMSNPPLSAAQLDALERAYRHPEIQRQLLSAGGVPVKPS